MRKIQDAFFPSFCEASIKCKVCKNWCETGFYRVIYRGIKCVLVTIILSFVCLISLCCNFIVDKVVYVSICIFVTGYLLLNMIKIQTILNKG